jgi:hypothetical protein
MNTGSKPTQAQLDKLGLASWCDRDCPQGHRAFNGRDCPRRESCLDENGYGNRLSKRDLGETKKQEREIRNDLILSIIKNLNQNSGDM